MNKPINLKPLSALLAEREAAQKLLADVTEFPTLYAITKEEAIKRCIDATAALDAEADKLIGAALTDAQGKARVRTITASDIAVALDEVERRLDISKRAMDGIHVTIDPNAQNFPNAYKGIPTSTIFRATYKRDHWTLDAIWRGVTLPSSRRVIVEHTAESEKAVMNRFRAWG